MAWVAAGRADGYFEAGVKAWDIAAGVLLVREAGGRCCDFRGRNSHHASPACRTASCAGSRATTPRSGC